MDFDNPTQRWHEDGYAQWDRPHVVNLITSYDNPTAVKVTEKFRIGWSAGGVFQLQSGRPIDRLAYNTWTQGYDNYLDKRGTQERAPAFASLDLRASVAFTISPVQIDVILQVFNVLNSLDVTYANRLVFDDQGDIVQTRAYGPAFGRPSVYQTPRRFELGVRVSF